jgi:hypothetical protein
MRALRYVLVAVALLAAPVLGVLVFVVPAWQHELGNRLPSAAERVLRQADVIELYSLEPDSTEGGLYGWKVLGKTTVEDPETRARLLGALMGGLVEPGKGGHKCFEPRHAVRASLGKKAVDLVICFECGWVYVHFDGKAKESHRLEINSDKQPLFDQVLREAGVTLPKRHN